MGMADNRGMRHLKITLTKLHKLRIFRNSCHLSSIPFLGRIPIYPSMDACADSGDLFIEKHSDSEVAEACKLIIEKIMGGERKW